MLPDKYADTLICLNLYVLPTILSWTRKLFTPASHILSAIYAHTRTLNKSNVVNKTVKDTLSCAYVGVCVPRHTS